MRQKENEAADLQAATPKRRKVVGTGTEDSPSLGMLEGDILRLLWNAGEPQSSVEVYEQIHFARRAAKEEMPSPSTIAVTLSRMVEKGMLTVERRPRAGKGYYTPTRTRAETTAAVLDDVTRRLVGQPLGYLLARLGATGKNSVPPIVTKETGEIAVVEKGMEELIATLRSLQQNDNTPLPHKTELY